METMGSTGATGMRTRVAAARASGVVRVADYDRAKRFYSEKLGLEVRDAVGQTREGRALAGDGTGFGFYERPSMPAPQNTTMAFDVDDVEAAVAELRDRGVTFEEYDLPEVGLKTVNGIAEQNGEKVAFFKDTEGNIFSVGCACNPK
jgi:predicted enzyme related to lactoylglutathione lyase